MNEIESFDEVMKKAVFGKRNSNIHREYNVCGGKNERGGEGGGVEN